MRRTPHAATTALTALTALLIASAPALAAAPQGPWGADRGPDHSAAMADRHMGQIMDALKLTADQRSKVATIRARHREQTRAQRQEVGAKRMELFKLVRAAKTSREQAIAKQREIDGLQAKLAEARLAAWFDARAVLTPDQLTQLEQLKLPDHGRRHGEGRRHRGQQE